MYSDLAEEIIDNSLAGVLDYINCGDIKINPSFIEYLRNLPKSPPPPKQPDIFESTASDLVESSFDAISQLVASGDLIVHGDFKNEGNNKENDEPVSKIGQSFPEFNFEEKKSNEPSQPSKNTKTKEPPKSSKKNKSKKKKVKARYLDFHVTMTPNPAAATQVTPAKPPRKPPTLSQTFLDTTSPLLTREEKHMREETNASLRKGQDDRRQWELTLQRQALSLPAPKTFNISSVNEMGNTTLTTHNSCDGDSHGREKRDLMHLRFLSRERNKLEQAKIKEKTKELNAVHKKRIPPSPFYQLVRDEFRKKRGASSSSCSSSFASPAVSTPKTIFQTPVKRAFQTPQARHPKNSRLALFSTPQPQKPPQTPIPSQTTLGMQLAKEEMDLNRSQLRRKQEGLLAKKNKQKQYSQMVKDMYSPVPSKKRTQATPKPTPLAKQLFKREFKEKIKFGCFVEKEKPPPRPKMDIKKQPKTNIVQARVNKHETLLKEMDDMIHAIVSATSLRNISWLKRDKECETLEKRVKQEAQTANMYISAIKSKLTYLNDISSKP